MKYIYGGAVIDSKHIPKSICVWFTGDKDHKRCNCVGGKAGYGASFPVRKIRGQWYVTNAYTPKRLLRNELYRLFGIDIDGIN